MPDQSRSIDQYAVVVWEDTGGTSRSIDQYAVAAWENTGGTNRSLDQYAFVVWDETAPSGGPTVTWTGRTRARAFTGRWRKKR